MTITEALIAFGAWLSWTAFILIVGRCLSKKRGWFYAGALALIGAVFGALAIHFFLGQKLQCQDSSCWSDKALVDTLLQFVLITWGAMGGAMIARIVDEK
ncbi:MAG: hypothetical protein Q8K94_06365 [Moraxellaceae bacterium]|nr:hypothetical protein [Moraxellaceae bacterium]MDP1776225.1 hypothetical protein [Moraxellaceae bacterium]